MRKARCNRVVKAEGTPGDVNARNIVVSIFTPQIGLDA